MNKTNHYFQCQFANLGLETLDKSDILVTLSPIKENPKSNKAILAFVTKIKIKLLRCKEIGEHIFHVKTRFLHDVHLFNCSVRCIAVIKRPDKIILMFLQLWQKYWKTSAQCSETSIPNSNRWVLNLKMIVTEGKQWNYSVLNSSLTVLLIMISPRY